MPRICATNQAYSSRVLADFFFKGIGKAQDYLVLSIIFTIVKYNELWQREWQQRFAIWIQP